MNVKELKALLDEFDENMPVRCAEMFNATVPLEEGCVYESSYFVDGEDILHLVIAG